MIDHVGKQMAEALLESDDSTASMSETSSMTGDSLSDDSSQSATQWRMNPRADIFQPRYPTGSLEHGHIHRVLPCFEPSRGVASPPHSLAISKYVALDCEMVGVGPGGVRSILARVSLVDYFGKCLFDTFVKVEENITDYRFDITGITAKNLSSSKAMPFGKCRAKVISLIRNKILVGHGLGNDLSCLGIHHPWYNIRDTSLYAPYQKKNGLGAIGPSKLRHLTKIHLGIQIQVCGRPHCPIEDACAAMALYRKHQIPWDRYVDSMMMQSQQRNFSTWNFMPGFSHRI